MQLSLVSILSELMGDTWCRLKVGSGLSLLWGIFFKSCFSEEALELSATERELGKVEFLELSHFCFLRRYASRTSLLRRTWITKMKNPWSEFNMVKIYWNTSPASVMLRIPNTQVRPKRGNSTTHAFNPCLKLEVSFVECILVISYTTRQRIKEFTRQTARTGAAKVQIKLFENETQQKSPCT